jgi:hypothetical protein
VSAEQQRSNEEGFWHIIVYWVLSSISWRISMCSFISIVLIMIYALYTRSIGLGAISVKIVLGLSAITIAAGRVWG